MVGHGFKSHLRLSAPAAIGDPVAGASIRRDERASEAVRHVRHGRRHADGVGRHRERAGDRGPGRRVRAQRRRMGLLDRDRARRARPGPRDLPHDPVHAVRAALLQGRGGAAGRPRRPGARSARSFLAATSTSPRLRRSSSRRRRCRRPRRRWRPRPQPAPGRSPRLPHPRRRRSGTRSAPRPRPRPGRGRGSRGSAPRRPRPHPPRPPFPRSGPRSRWTRRRTRPP